MPASDYGGPVTKDAKGCVELYQALIEYCKLNEIAYVRMCLMDPLQISLFSPLADTIELTKGVMEIDLSSGRSEQIFKHFSPSTRTRIRQLDRSALEGYEAHSKSELSDFYRIYALNTAEHHENRPCSYSFLERMWQNLYPKNLRLWLMGKNRPIGGLLFLKDQHGSYGYSIGIDRAKAPVHLSIIQYLTWKETVEAEKEGMRKISLGSTPSDPNEIHHKMKARTGATFRQQKTVWIPMSASGHAVLLMRKRTENLWRKNRNLLPKKARWVLETRLVKL